MNTDEKKKKIIMLFIALGLILSVIFGVTFSYLAPTINNAESNSTVAFNAGTIAINYENGQNQINASGVLPGWTSIKEFSLTAINNTTISTSGAMNYAIKLIVEKNTFNDGTITYSIEGENVNNNGTIAYVLPNSLKKGASEVILGYGVFDTSSDISKGVTHRYTLTMAFPNKTYESQNEDSGKTLSAHIIIANEGESTFSNLTIIDDINNLNKTMILKNNTEYELPNIASKAGAYFLGWNVESGNAIINGNKITINGNATIKANYSSTNKIEFAYTGNEQLFTAPVAGTYKLETWGAQGGTYNETYFGGYGGYSSGLVYLKKGTKLYVNVGGMGSFKITADTVSTVIGGYNGGGTGTSGGDGSYSTGGGSGGGTTHIALGSGLLSSQLSSADKILIVAGGGGGASVNSYNSYTFSYSGAAGGGASGNSASGEKTSCTAGNQTSGNTFGMGGNYATYTHGAAGGGGGYYGGTGGGVNAPGCGGSGYIGNSLLTNKIMYCYNCTESSAETTKTISTTCHNSTPTENCAKEGNGYARITMPEIKERRDLSTITVVSEELKKVITIEAEKGEETEISVEGLTNSSLGFKSFEIEKGEATINKTKITPLSDTIVVRIIYNQIFNWEFAYTGSEQTFVAPVSGTYRLETWGAGWEDSEAVGGYSTGTVSLNKNDLLYVYIGGTGTFGKPGKGGYNGGGNGATSSNWSSRGGSGATHISTKKGLLKQLSQDINSIIIVSGGNGGSYQYTGADGFAIGGSGGGYIGGNGSRKSGICGAGATQKKGGKGFSGSYGVAADGSFGLGGDGGINTADGGGGGGGFYGGGGCTDNGGAGGGSGYIGNPLLSNKAMYCYNCSESSDEDTKTISTTCHSLTPTENCAKNGNGFARITLIS